MNFDQWWEKQGISANTGALTNALREIAKRGWDARDVYCMEVSVKHKPIPRYYTDRHGVTHYSSTDELMRLQSINASMLGALEAVDKRHAHIQVFEHATPGYEWLWDVRSVIAHAKRQP